MKRGIVRVQTVGKREKGEDSYGNKYSSLAAMWEQEFSQPKKFAPEAKEDKKRIGGLANWYTGSNNYWNNVSQDDAGMLQGWERVTAADIECSSNFLQSYIKTNKILPAKAIDCGGGIGRVSRELLTKFFSKVDIVDQASNLIQAAKTNVKSERMRNFYVSGLQDFEFPDKYNCIWVQWVLMHMPDEDAVKLLKKCKASLAKKVSSFASY
eukprot:TRINITY_DN6192_c0_g2_i1.p1 TRINITY_DN6192_c0_g2~~TRINITY_DN6192_c0_g2_i1.p1  ORF type:complete len:210 (+),score=44.93 TRINITY_DN6192_c0_g2_i1:186-815(+)